LNRIFCVGNVADLLTRMDASPSLRVVVFESANPEFYLAHFDLTGKIRNIMTPRSKYKRFNCSSLYRNNDNPTNNICESNPGF
jgi:enoyl-CoA hydratase/carnithine racemase